MLCKVQPKFSWLWCDMRRDAINRSFNSIEKPGSSSLTTSHDIMTFHVDRIDESNLIEQSSNRTTTKHNERNIWMNEWVNEWMNMSVHICNTLWLIHSRPQSYIVYHTIESDPLPHCHCRCHSPSPTGTGPCHLILVVLGTGAWQGWRFVSRHCKVPMCMHQMPPLNPSLVTWRVACSWKPFGMFTRLIMTKQMLTIDIVELLNLMLNWTSVADIFCFNNNLWFMIVSQWLIVLRGDGSILILVSWNNIQYWINTSQHYHYYHHHITLHVWFWKFWVLWVQANNKQLPSISIIYFVLICDLCNSTPMRWLYYHCCVLYIVFLKKTYTHCHM